MGRWGCEGEGGPPETSATRSDRDRHRLVVVEEQRRQLGAGTEAVPTGNALDGNDRITKVAQFVQVAADSPSRHAEPVGEFLARPGTANLKQPENP